MDNPTINTKRDEVPDWAKPENSSAGAVANEAMAGKPKVSPAQRSYLLSLIEQKQIQPKDEGNVDLVMKCLRISESDDEYGMSKDYASTLIDWFKALPDKPREDRQANLNNIMTERFVLAVPAGRYAVENNQGELRFYNVWVSRDKTRIKVYVAHGPDESELPGQATQLAVLSKIKAAGIREAAIRYGLEIGECSNCGRRLTNRISRELGIGPVCGGRMFEDNFSEMVSAKRAEITARGEDPDEELDD